MLETAISIIPYIFIILHFVGIWNTKEDIKEIKHILWIILWMVVVIGDKIVGL